MPSGHYKRDPARKCGGRPTCFCGDCQLCRDRVFSNRYYHANKARILARNAVKKDLARLAKEACEQTDDLALEAKMIEYFIAKGWDLMYCKEPVSIGAGTYSTCVLQVGHKGKCLPRRGLRSASDASNAVEHPAHYGGNVLHETIKCLAAWGLESNALLWNAVKYISRAGKKGELLEDLKKSRWYLDRAIEKAEKENG